MRRVIVAGSVNVDLSIRMPRLPSPGETLKGQDVLLDLGGKGANQAIAAARLGAATIFHGAIGGDEFASYARGALTRESFLRLELQVVAGRSTGMAAILTDEAGQNMIALSPGSNAALDGAQVANDFQKGDLLLLQNETSPECNLALAIAMRKAGGLVILDPAPADGITDDLIQHADIVTPNETEAQALTGIDVRDDKAALAAAKALCARGAGAAIIKLGGKGAVLHVSETTARLGSAVSVFIPAVAVAAVDTVAAGDCFNGALAVALADGQSLPDACQFASAAAALSVSRRGASTSLPTREELMRFLEINNPPRSLELK
jgi:ribokinase